MHYLECPKCRHSPLPQDQSLPAACPECGLILAKYVDPPLPRERIERRSSWLDTLLAIPDRVEPWEWWGRLLTLVWLGIWGWRLAAANLADGEIGQSFAHAILLPFHEAGHVIFRPFGEFVTYLGGTLGQLLMPIILGTALLLQRGDTFGASLGLWLFSVSLLDVAPYMYDALHPQLILLSGTTGEYGDHDWIYLFGSLNVLDQAQEIGRAVHRLGIAFMAAANLWGISLIWRQYRYSRAE